MICREVWFGAAVAHDGQDRFDELPDGHAPDDLLCLQEILGGHHRGRLCLRYAGGGDQNLTLRLKVGVADIDLQQEAIELRSGSG